MKPTKIQFTLGGCEHPFKEVTAYAISGLQDTKDAEFQIHFICNRCGHEMIMLSKGHVASKKERDIVEARNEPKRESPEPGFG